MITTEIRFFTRLPKQEHLSKILAALPLSSAEERVDHYLKLEASAMASLKWRQGGLELKSKIGNSEDHPELEVWEKQRIEDEGKHEYPPHTVAVTKKRWLLYYDEDLNRITPAQSLQCQLEFSKLSIMGHSWLSLSLEASGSSTSQQAGLLIKVKDSLPQVIMQAFDLSHPLSYPEFLLKYS